MPIAVAEDRGPSRLSSIVLLLVLAAGGSAQDQAVDQSPLGWEWVSPPRSIGEIGPRPMTWASGEVAVTFGRSDGGRLFATVARVGPLVLDGTRTDYRLVAFDGRGVRSEHGSSSSAGSRAITVMSFDLGTLDRMPARVGVEVLRPEGRKRIAAAAQAEAEEKGLEVLPLPEPGKPLAFELTDVTGAPVRSQDLRGKVVLIDCWATWCGPCMAKMPALRKLWDEWHERGLEVVGISFDRTLDDCKKAIAEKGLAWRIVRVPDEQDVRDLWERASGVSSLPRLFVIDRDGVVREDFYPTDVEATVRPYLEAQPRAR